MPVRFLRFRAFERGPCLTTAILKEGTPPNVSGPTPLRRKRNRVDYEALDWGYPAACVPPKEAISLRPFYALIVAIGLAHLWPRIRRSRMLNRTRRLPHRCCVSGDRACDLDLTQESAYDSATHRPDRDLRVQPVFVGHRIEHGRCFHFGLTRGRAQDDRWRQPAANLYHLGWVAVYLLVGAVRLRRRGQDRGARYRDGLDHHAVETRSSGLLRDHVGAALETRQGCVLSGGPRGAARDGLAAPPSSTPRGRRPSCSYCSCIGVSRPNAFSFPTPIRAYIYDAFSRRVAAELTNGAQDSLPKIPDLSRLSHLFFYDHASRRRSALPAREPARTELSRLRGARAVRGELSGRPLRSRSVAHCEVFARSLRGAQNVSIVQRNRRSLPGSSPARRGLKFSACKMATASASGQWTLPQSAGEQSHAPGHVENARATQEMFLLLHEMSRGRPMICH